MPLFDISANVAGLDSPTRKRTHEEFVDTQCHEMVQSKLSFAGAVRSQDLPAGHPPQISVEAAASPPPESSPASLTDGASTPAVDFPSPNHTPPRQAPAPPISSSTATAAMASTTVDTDATSGEPSTMPATIVVSTNTPSASTTAASTPTKIPEPPTTAEPPAKRKRLTVSEKEERAKAEELKRQQREQEKAAKLAEKAKLDEEKKAKAEEAKKKREEKEEEARKKAEEKERKRREKEDEQRRLQEAKDKKERSQLKLASFFKTGPSTPSKAAAQPLKATTPNHSASPSGTPQKATAAAASSAPDPSAADGLTEYQRIFKPFFVKERVKLARNAFEVDEAARQAKTLALDSFVCGLRTFEPPPFSGPCCVEYFCLPGPPPRRGRPYPSVRKIMSILSDASACSSSAPIDLTSDAKHANSQATKSARELLKEVPMKYLCFYQDVRPAYYGTVSSTPPSARSLHKLARNPTSRDLLPLQYDYDSEAEWVDDGDGEDIDDLDDDEEDNADDDEDMADFLDDSEDVIKRPVFASGMEPESSGLCFENRKRLGPSDQLYKFRMEFILDLDHHHSIDPFASHYWEPEAKSTSAPTSLHPSTATSMKPPAAVATAPAAPTNAFAAMAQGNPSAAAAAKKAALIPPETLDDFKRAILKYPKLSKVGLVEILSSEFDKCTKAQVKNSVEAMAERSGTGHEKMWRLKREYAL